MCLATCRRTIVLYIHFGKWSNWEESNILITKITVNVIAITWAVIFMIKLYTFYSPSCLGQETAKKPFVLRVKMPTAHLSTIHGVQWCRFLLSIGGNNLQFYPDFALFSTLRRMNLDHDFFPVSKLSEDQKKAKDKVFTEN